MSPAGGVRLASLTVHADYVVIIASDTCALRPLLLPHGGRWDVGWDGWVIPRSALDSVRAALTAAGWRHVCHLSPQ